MPIELKDVKVLRKKFGLSQTELARAANVSQSLIAKVEANRLDPTYSNAKKIFDALESLSKKHEVKAEQIMEKKIISIMPDTSIKEVITKMKSHEISQMPVIVNDKVIGLVSETNLLDAVMQGKKYSAEDIMQDAPPIVSRNTSVEVVSSLLRYFPMVLVHEKGKLLGLITKSDLVRKMYK